MVDVTIIIPTIFDNLTDILNSVEFWGAISVMSIITVFASRYYRRIRGWL